MKEPKWTKKMLKAQVKHLQCEVKVWEETCKGLQWMLVQEQAVREYIKSEEFNNVKIKSKEATDRA